MSDKLPDALQPGVYKLIYFIPPEMFIGYAPTFGQKPGDVRVCHCANFNAPGRSFACYLKWGDHVVLRPEHRVPTVLASGESRIFVHVVFMSSGTSNWCNSGWVTYSATSEEVWWEHVGYQ